MRTWTHLAVGFLLMQAIVHAGPIFNLSYLIGNPGIACDGALTSTATSETLAIGACTGASSQFGQSYIAGSATPLEVSLTGEAGLFDGYQLMTITGTAEYEGLLEAVGGIGQAWLAFDMSGTGANGISGSFTIPSEGVQARVDADTVLHDEVPLTFGAFYEYTLSVSNSYTWGQPDTMQGDVQLRRLHLVDADGEAIAGSSVFISSGGFLATPQSSVPEPGGGLLAAVGSVMIVGLRVRGRRNAPRQCRTIRE